MTILLTGIDVYIPVWQVDIGKLPQTKAQSLPETTKRSPGVAAVKAIQPRRQ
jgi:hypothetical protein